MINRREIKVLDKDEQDNNALHLALIHGKPEVFTFLYNRAKERKKGLNFMKAMKQINSAKKLPLHIACQKCNTRDEGKRFGLKDF